MHKLTFRFISSMLLESADLWKHHPFSIINFRIHPWPVLIFFYLCFTILKLEIFLKYSVRRLNYDCAQKLDLSKNISKIAKIAKITETICYEVHSAPRPMGDRTYPISEYGWQRFWKWDSWGPMFRGGIEPCAI